MATFAQLQARVVTRLIDLPPSVLAEVPTLVIEAHKELQVRHNFKVMEAASATLATTAGSHTLEGVPTDFKDIRTRPVLVPQVGRPIRMIYAPSREAIERHYADSDVGVPGILLDAEPDVNGVRNFEVWPLSDGASDWTTAPVGQYRIRLSYWHFLPDLVNGTDSDWFTNDREASLFIINKAVSEGFFLDWDEQRAQVWLARAETEFNKVVHRDKLSQLSQTENLAVHWRGVNDTELEDGDFTVPFNVADWFP